MTLYDDPDNQFVAGFVGSPKMKFLPAELASADAGSVKLTGLGQMASASLPIGGVGGGARPVTLGVRPEHFGIVADGAPQGELELQARVGLVEELGAESFVHLTLNDGTPLPAGGRNDAGAMQYLLEGWVFDAKRPAQLR